MGFWRRPDEVRYARRMARIARWDRPLQGRGDRLRAWANMLLADHGVFRVAYLNLFQVTPQFWRSAQPTPNQIDRLARRGLRTVINLRGGREHGAWPLEREACERNGVKLVEFVVRSREAPSRETIHEAREFFRQLEYPALAHCKSGADRAGMMSALYLILHENRPVREAMRQLSWRYGHFRFARTGVLDAFFEAYLREGEANGLDFLTWVDTVYDPEAVKRNFRPGFLSDLLVDRIIRRE
ncbi:tyrosine-protein phosphatase [Camelimonas abortus]|uniref:Tyrosine-protein phosphatase n=1 Tax=Camelimonas abortus TaxID=1017184 RepID=A0ABV7LDA5_9HYPH